MNGPLFKGKNNMNAKFKIPVLLFFLKVANAFYFLTTARYCPKYFMLTH